MCVCVNTSTVSVLGRFESVYVRAGVRGGGGGGVGVCVMNLGEGGVYYGSVTRGFWVWLRWDPMCGAVGKGEKLVWCRCT